MSSRILHYQVTVISYGSKCTKCCRVVCIAPTLLVGPRLFHFYWLTSPRCHINLEPNQSVQCRAHTCWALQHLVLWSLCPFEDLTPNTCMLYKEMEKTEVYFTTIHTLIFNQ